MTVEVRAPLAGKIWKVLVEWVPRSTKTTRYVIEAAEDGEYRVLALQGHVKEIKVKKDDRVEDDRSSW